MAKKKSSLFGRETDINPDLYDELIAHSGEGLSKNQEDYIWIGEDGTLRSDDWLEDHFGRIYLEAILYAIITGRYPNAKDRIIRVHAAISQLTGEPQQKGRKGKKHEKMVDVARRWFEEWVTSKKEPILSDIIKDVFDYKNEQEGEITACRRYFSKHKDDLLKTATGFTLIEREDRRLRLRSIVRDLRALGIPCADIERPNPRN